jgi:hypothetical protein
VGPVGAAGARDAAGPVRGPRFGLRLATAGALAVAIAAGLVVVENLGGTSHDGGARSVVPGLRGVPVASAEVLERAAAAVEKQPFVAPRNDQWIYTEDRFTSSDGSAPQTQQQWRRADGGGIARIEDGKLRVQSIPLPKGRRAGAGYRESYKALAALPTDPDALLRWAYALDISNGNSPKDAVVYLLFNGILRGNLLPPELEAGIFRAMKEIPGVSVETTVDVQGHPAYALGQTDDWLHQELLLDRNTYAYRGQRSTVVRDATIDPLKAGNSTGKVQKGHTVVAVRLAAGIVDRPGERP